VVTRIRLKIELNPGGMGVRLDKLAKISEEIEKFLRALAKDVGAAPQIGDFLAREFRDGSFHSMVEYVHNVEPVIASKFNDGLLYFSDFKESQQITGFFAPETIRQFIEIGDALDPAELIKIGVIAPDGSPENAEWKSISKITTLNVDNAFNQDYSYEGAVQGRLATRYKESNYFYLKDQSTRESVKCVYRDGMYDQIYRLFEDKDAVVNVVGKVRAKRATGKIDEIRVNWVKSYAPLSDAEFDRLFGIAPDITGEMSSSDYIDKMRNGEN
jgi:hypothetical protein